MTDAAMLPVGHRYRPVSTVHISALARTILFHLRMPALTVRTMRCASTFPTILISGQACGELRSALSQGKAAQAEQYNARLVIATSVARTWIQLARQYAQLDLNQQQLDVTAKIAHLTQLRLDAGLDAI